jgi:hypothetical protein
MATLKLKQGRFQVARQILDNSLFDEWITGDGRGIMAGRYRDTRMRWFFGRSRARAQLHKELRGLLAPKSHFAGDIEQHVDELPLFIGKIGQAIRRRGIRDLITSEGCRTVVAVPRGIVQHDYKVALIKELEDTPELRKYPGLARCAIGAMALDAEEVLFAETAKKPLADTSGAGLLMDVDAEFRWRINEVDGHYYYGFTEDAEENLDNRRNLRRFRNAMKEVVHAQAVHLKRMQPHDRAALAETFMTVPAARTQQAQPDPAPVTL